jgi:hypothetical protein
VGDGRAGLGTPPRILTGAFRLRALEIDDWVVEQQLSSDPAVVRWTYYPADLDEARARRRIEELLERTAADWCSVTSSSARQDSVSGRVASENCPRTGRRSSTR